MKKYIPYSIGLIALVILIILIIASPKKNNHVFDERITLQQKDKIPYGTFVSFRLLSFLFPKSEIIFSKQFPATIHLSGKGDTNQALFFIANAFDPGQYEFEKLLAFASRGNHVVIIAKNLSYNVTKHLSIDEKQKYFSLTGGDTLSIALTIPTNSELQKFLYPGKQYDAFFSKLDTSQSTLIVGKDHYGAPNFIQMKRGKGSIYIHLAPLAFSNYFLLHKNNAAYFQKAISLIPQSVTNVIWNEYYLTKRKVEKEKDAGILSVLLKYPSFQAALYSALTFLFLFVIMQMRRKQRIIPIIVKPQNDSLDFVKTMGRLYYGRKDHKNLSRKMATYFMEHIRMKFKLQPLQLDDDFVQELHKKTDYPVPDLNEIIYFIKYSEEAQSISEIELSRFYKKLEHFYLNS
ncbi:MAG TPA: DUF4350 domain-containing protein [Chitinophagaceae bacterium]|nr:DUF4350 domain-containing protein [Chitinophagaceae bacterium]